MCISNHWTQSPYSCFCELRPTKLMFLRRINQHSCYCCSRWQITLAMIFMSNPLIGLDRTHNLQSLANDGPLSHRKMHPFFYFNFLYLFHFIHCQFRRSHDKNNLYCRSKTETTGLKLVRRNNFTVRLAVSFIIKIQFS